MRMVDSVRSFSLVILSRGIHSLSPPRRASVISDILSWCYFIGDDYSSTRISSLVLCLFLSPPHFFFSLSQWNSVSARKQHTANRTNNRNLAQCFKFTRRKIAHRMQIIMKLDIIYTKSNVLWHFRGMKWASFSVASITFKWMFFLVFVFCFEFF